MAASLDARSIRLRRIESLLGELYDNAIKPVMPPPQTILEQTQRRKHREGWIVRGVVLMRALAHQVKMDHQRR